MLSLLTDTGIGSVLMILAGVVGIPVAYRWDTKKKPGVRAPGQTDR